MKPFDANGAFLTPADSSGLRRLAVRGAGVTVLSQGMMFAVQLLATVVLARLLKPSDFGLVAMVTTFSVFLASVGQIGFQEAVLQREEIDHRLASNLFWIQPRHRHSSDGRIRCGWITTGQVLWQRAGGACRHRLFTDDSFDECLSSAPGSSQARYALSTVSAINVLGRTVSVAVSILLAWAGWGYWALVVGAVGQALTAYPSPLASFARGFRVSRGR